MKDNPLDILIRQLASLPGLGPRSARRAALHLITRKQESLYPLSAALEQAAQTIQECATCGNIDHINPCRICTDPQRDHTTLCVVANISDIWAIERTKSFKGIYHVLGGVLSALDGITPEELRIKELKARVEKSPPHEIILALNATVDGQSTAHYIIDTIQNEKSKISRLAHGVPVGGELDYLDDGTIATALKSRSSL